MNWNDVVGYTKNKIQPDREVAKTEQEWKAQLTPEQFRITRQHGTERPFSSQYCEAHTAGVYACVCCGTELFDSTLKFCSGTGWPSFTEPVKENVVEYKMDNAYGMQRIEALCNVCKAHLGHVFPDGPQPSGLRFCINSASLKKTDSDAVVKKSGPGLETVTLGGGCFWCIEAVLDELKGVERVESGYAGGTKESPAYRDVSNGSTGHAEVVQFLFDPTVLSYADILRIFLTMHNPTTLNKQGADIGSQYRSIILYHREAQHQTALEVIKELQLHFEKNIVTEVAPYTAFYKAEEHHQQYYKKDPSKAYCNSVINPKLAKLKEHFKELLKKKTPAAIV